MATLLVVIVTCAVLMFLNGLYVAAEFGTVKARHDRTQVAQMADSGDRLAKQLIPFMQEPKLLDRYVAACQLGITVSSLVLGAYGQNMVAGLLAPLLAQLGGLADAAAYSIATTAVLIILTILQMILAELVPKSVAVQFPVRTALMTVVPMKWSLFILRPFITIFNGSGNAILRLFGVSYADEHGDFHSLDEIERLVAQTHEGGLIEDNEQQMLRNAFRMRQLTAREVMVPRTRMITADVVSTISEVLTTAIEGGFSRIPVYEDTIDNVIGFVHIKDLFRRHMDGDETSLKSMLRDVIHIPETMPITDVWSRLNEKRQYLVIVFDEHGGTEGMITFEDVIEEIFGELQDEFDEHEMALMSYDMDGRTHLRGDLLITDINEYLNLNLPYDDATTLGGLVFNLMGRPPSVGDEITVENLKIRVENVTDQGISEVSFEAPDSGPIKVDEWETATHE